MNILKSIVSSIQDVGKRIKGSPIAKKITSGILALTVIISPISPVLTVHADELKQFEEISEETTLDQTGTELTEVIIPTEKSIPDYSDNISNDQVIAENDDIVAADPTETIDTTAPPTEQETTGEGDVSNIFIAQSAEEYFQLISSLPDGYQRIIVDTHDDLSNIKVSSGVYFDGTYILVFDSGDSYSEAVKVIHNAGYEYAVDGTISVCGKYEGFISYAGINPDAKARVAVIDTGSNLANESYSVIGEDTADNNGHGTAMSEFILNETDNAYIISIKAIGDDGKGQMSDVYAAVQLAEELGVDYILMAISIRNIGKYDAFISLIENTKAKVIASAGNNGADAVKFLPAGIPGVITIGSLNEDGTLRSTSNYGESVDYYVIADSTSEAAAMALGFIADGRVSELATRYKELSETDNTSDSSEATADLIERTEDENVFTVNRKGQSSVTIRRVSWFYQSDYFTAPVASDAEFGVYSDEPESSDGKFHWDSDYILYCIENTKDWPDGITYSRNSSTNNMLAVAAAAGPDGALYSYAVAWWKANGTSEITSTLKNTGANTLDWKRAMYCITHFTMDRIYTGSWSSSAPRNNNSVWSNYYNWLSGLNGGSALSDGKIIQSGSKWCEIYSYTDSDYQKMARGGVSLSTPAAMSFTVDKSSTLTVDPGFFSFEGTTYTLYGDFSAVLDPQTMEPGEYQLRNALKTFVMGADGTTSTTYSATITSGTTYYLKETAAAPGYETDDTIYWVYLSTSGTISAGVMESYVSGGRTRWRQAEDSEKVTVTDSTLDIVHLKDTPKAIFNLDKKLSVNYDLLADQTYNFELWDNTDNVKVATGTAKVPSSATNNTTTPVIWSNIASGYGLFGNSIILFAGHNYQVMETTLSVNGLNLETPSGWTKGNAHNKECFYQNFTAGKGSVNALSITNDTKVSYISASKTLGTNYQLLRGRTYTFELWDETDNVKVADASAVISASAAVNTVTVVTWSNVNTSAGYKSASNNRVQVKSGHTYELMETITVVDGRNLSTPSGWTKGTVHGKTCFYKTATLNAGADTGFTINNDIKVPLSLTKASTDTAKTNGNSAYSLEGTTYVLAKDTAFSSANTVGTIVMNANGTAKSSVDVVCGTTYYLKETKAGTGYKLDTAVYKIVVAANGTATASVQAGTAPATPAVTNSTNGNPILVNLKDAPDNVNISLTKASANLSVTDNNSCYSLNGTAYGLYSSSADANTNANRLTTFTVNASGVTSTTFSSAYGKTYYLKEITAGKGYNLDDTVYTVTVNAYGVVTISNTNGAKVTKSGAVYYLNVQDTPKHDPLKIALKKVDKTGYVIHNATFSGAVFEISYYAQDLGASGNNNAAPTVVYRYTLNGSSATIELANLQALTPVGGSDPNYLKNLPSSWDEYPYGTVRIREITAPAGYMLNDQIVRYRLGTTVSYSVENNSSYSNRNYWKQLADGTLELTELPKVGYYALTKSLEDTTIRSSVAGFEFELYNTSSQASPVLIATGVSQADGRVLWTYKAANYYSNTDNSKLLTNTTAYNLELPATEKNSAGAETAIQYQVREIKSSIAIAYGASGIPYTYSAPTTNGTAWNNSADYFYKVVTVNNSTTVKQEGIANNYEYTGLNVNKVVPSGNPFDMTKVTFKLYNTDSNKLIANGSVDSKGNVTWNRADKTGYGITPASSVNVINSLPLGHYRVEEIWNKTYIDVSSSVRILVEDSNKSGWTKTETATAYTYSKDIDLSSKSNDGKVTALVVENKTDVQKFNLTKTVTVEGDAPSVQAELYQISGSNETLIATGTAKTTGKGTFGFTWSYNGKHTTENGIDTLVLPVGKYRIVEICPATYYKTTQVPYTYKTPAGYSSRTAGGKLHFYKDFELKSGDFVTLESGIENTRIEGSFDIVKIERSGSSTSKTFTFEIYYRGNGASASSSSTLLETVKVTTANGKGSATLSKLPEGWYEIREVGAGSSWTSHWVNESSVSNGSKIVRLDSNNRTNAVLTVNDGVRENGKAINAVVIYNDMAPEIKTTLTDKGTGDHVSFCSAKTTFEDTVTYMNLLPGHYVMSGVLMNKKTGKELLDSKGNKITGSTEFDVSSEVDEYGEAKLKSGSVKVTYTLDTTVIKDVTVVAYEELHKTSASGILITKHADINDAAQTVYIPDIKTTLIDSVTNSHISACSETAKLVDTVSYSNLLAGKTYTLSGELMDKKTGKPLGITATKKFKPSSVSGTITIEFTVDTKSLTGITVVAFETLKFNGKDVAIHADINDVNQTVEIPDIRTTLLDSKTKEHISVCSVSAKLTDTVTYTNLIPGKEYTLTGTLMDKSTGKSLGITVTKSFKPGSAAGTETIEFTADTAALKGITIVAFETLKLDGKEIAVHADISDADQTVYVPEIHTTLTDQNTKEHISSCSDKAALTDTVTYKNLLIGKTYTVEGTLMDKATGKSLGITAAKTFKPVSSSGTVTIDFTVDTKSLEGKTVVAFETLKYNSLDIAVHSDINDIDQTVYIPEIRTSLADSKTNDHISAYSKTAKLVDTVTYKNLIPDKEYILTGTLMDKATGKSLAITATKTFKPASASGTVTVEFNVDTTVLKGKTIVAFESLKCKDTEIAVHADIRDAAQTLEVPEIRTTLTDSKTQDHVSSYSKTALLTDTITYSNLIPGKEYTVTGTLMNKDTGKSLGITAEKKFKPEKDSGMIMLEFTVDTTLLTGVTSVAFETVSYKGIDIAVHADINDTEQTVWIPEIRTTLTDFGTREHVAGFGEKTTLIDTVSYKNLITGTEYTVSGVLMDKKTGKELKDGNGNAITASKTFTPAKGDVSVDIEFKIDTTKINDVTVVAFETLYHNNSIVAEHSDINDVDQTVYIPKIRTTLKDTVTSDHVAAESTVTLVDTVRYSNLLPGKDYAVKGILYNKATGDIILDENGNPITGTTEFSPKSPDGTVDIVFRFSSKLLQDTAVVAFEELRYKDIEIATHTEISDEDQTVYFPKIRTTLLDTVTKEHVAGPNETIKFVDTVAYTNLKPGYEYTMSGTIMDRETGESLKNNDGNAVASEITFTPESSSGSVEITFEFDGSLLAGKTFVAFEECRYAGKAVATHNDLKDSGQTVDIPDIHTTFFDKEIGEDKDFVRADKEVTLVDRVYYTNLTPGLEYTLTGTVMLKETNEALKDEKGNAVVQIVKFTPDTSKGFIDVEFILNTEILEGQTIVAFETLEFNGITLVIHADIEDVDQTVHIPKIRTTAVDGDNRTHTLTYKQRVTIVDTVVYENLIPGRTYVVDGTLYNAETGEIYKDSEGKTYISSVEYTPEEANGSIQVVFENVLVPYSRTKAVVFEDLSDKETGIKIKTHADITDTDQTVERPSAWTTAVVDGKKEIWLKADEVRNITVTDTITYKGLEVGTLYRAEATLYKSDGTQLMLNGRPLTSMVRFTPQSKDGTVSVNITFSSEGFEDGDAVVVFEKIFDVATEAEKTSGAQTNDLLVAKHENLSDKDQTVTVHYHPPLPQTGEKTPKSLILGIAAVLAGTGLGAVILFRKKKEE